MGSRKKKKKVYKRIAPHTVSHWLYFLLQDRKVVYIGVTYNLKARMKEHRDKEHNAVHVWKIDYVWTAWRYEQRWIMKLRPMYNKQVFNRGHERRSLISAIIPISYKEKIKMLSKQQKITPSEFVRRVLQSALTAEDPKHPAPAQAGNTSTA